jgi:hypothetical protein
VVCDARDAFTIVAPSHDNRKMPIVRNGKAKGEPQ